MAKLFILFVILPILEIALLINVSDQIGGWYTLAIVVLTAFFGARLVRQEGLSTLATAQQKMQTGKMPGQEMAEGLLLVIAGVLLVTPGFITDGLGFLLSLPMTRPVIAKNILKHMTVSMVNQNQSYQTDFNQQTRSNFDFQHKSGERTGETIEGEFEDKDENVKPTLRKPD
ncbi:FxsA family protein [Paraglaciecola aquimarina]|uniref:FxsA family protein n=1 Tax=Paraglaciecola aquimarina TaxID=1235557 RepID=A0ABU3SU02_9ALTE|nr:FxsA family protein [Paraglaciecola aquimarina]MDU0353491.1 FxsA family protein [Paraglaciecola aquimarina]